MTRFGYGIVLDANVENDVRALGVYEKRNVREM
jgi:hypothetical protein